MQGNILFKPEGKEYKIVFVLSVLFVLSFLLGSVFIKYSDISFETSLSGCVKDYVDTIAQAKDGFFGKASLALLSSLNNILILALSFLFLFTPFCLPVICVLTVYEGFSFGLSTVSLASYFSNSTDKISRPLLSFILIILILTVSVFITLLCFCQLSGIHRRLKSAYLSAEKNTVLSLSAYSFINVLFSSGALVLIKFLCFITNII